MLSKTSLMGRNNFGRRLVVLCILLVVTGWAFMRCLQLHSFMPSLIGAFGIGCWIGAIWQIVEQRLVDAYRDGINWGSQSKHP